MPWLFGGEAYRVTNFFTDLKCRLMPYIYEKGVEAHRDGTPVMHLATEGPQTDMQVNVFRDSKNYTRQDGRFTCIIVLKNKEKIGCYYLLHKSFNMLLYKHI